MRSIYAGVTSVVYTPPLKVTLMVPRAPNEFTTGKDAKNAPVSVIFGLVADSAPEVGWTMIVVDVPTNALSVAQVSVAAKLA